VGGCESVASGSGWGQVAGSCGRCGGPSGSIGNGVSWLVE
jgi:hypothetical protein